jgi:dTMP kinase
VSRPGRLVALEGIDGAGKSTFARRLAAALRRRGLSVAVHREPTDRRLGALAQSATLRDPWTGAVFFTVDRHLARPHLERDLRRRDVVITDRSFYSTLAYQGSALPPRDRRRLEQLQRGAAVRPDRVLFLDIDPRTALARVGRRPSDRAPLEREATLRRVAAAYRRLAARPGWTRLDARRPPQELVSDALEALGIRGRGRPSDRRRRYRRATPRG